MATNADSQPLDVLYEPSFSWDVLDDDPNMSSNINDASFGELNDSPLNNHFSFECDGILPGESTTSFGVPDEDLPHFIEDFNADNIIDEFLWSDPVDASAEQATTGEDPAKSPEAPRTQDNELGEDLENQGDEDEESSEPKRELRPQARKIKGGFITTWVDQDDTGDFDPTEENRQAHHRRNRVRLRQRAALTCQAKPHCKRDSAVAEAPEQLIVAFKFHTDPASTQFTKLVQNLPAPSSSTDQNGYSLRKRAHDIESTYNNGYARKRQRIGDNDDLPDDPTGHPFARGCWACVELGQDCSLLEDEFSWPCATCIEDDTECDLIIPPERKRACERCKSRKTSCSFKYTLNHGVACQQCMDRGDSCLAGPANEGIRMRVRAGRTEPAPPEKVPKIKDYQSCADCRELERDCSFETDGNYGMNGVACAQCIESGSQCCPRNFPPQHYCRPQRSDFVEKIAEEAVETVQEQVSPGLPEASKPIKSTKPSDAGTTRTITTKFCHPMVFNHDDSTSGAAPCHFCADAAFGLLGLGKREVEITDRDNSQGFEEVRGGHRNEGIESTRMCPSCTLERLDIIMCQEHKMEQMPGHRSRKADDDTALMDLLSGDVNKGRQWCAICPTPASYRCCAPGEGGTRGCGLLMCLRCAITHATTYGGDLQEMLSTLKDEPSTQKPLGLRADYELLKQDGLLMRHLFHGNA